MTTESKSPKSQSDKFVQAAKELGADEDLERFEDKLKKIAKHKPKVPEAEK